MNIARLDAHHKLYISLTASLLIFAISYGKIATSTQLIFSWIGYAVTFLGLSLSTIFSVHPIEMKKIARIQDNNRTLIFLFVLAAGILSLFVVVLLLKNTRHLAGTALTLHILLSVMAMLCSWALVHILFVFRYADLYYESVEKGASRSKYTEGLEFPEEDKPDYLDFTYFSFVIGMTFQVSDVEISSRKIRRLALLHSLVSFAFNTIIVAFSINIISGLMSK